jgi:MoaA/NifB/PqqE/SkfB family radical SAM enzyme
MTIISNQVTHKILLLKDESSYLWSTLESGTFDRDEALRYLASVGSESPENDIDGFIQNLSAERCLSLSDGLSLLMPEVPPAPETVSATPNIGPILNEADRALEDEVATFAEANGFLFSAFWEMTNRCNEKCVHCFNPGAPHAKGEKSARSTNELSTAEGKKLIREFHEAGAYRLILSGGEVLLRRDFFELVAYARSLHMQVHIFTNGVLLTEEKLQRLARLYPETVAISIYSATPDIHDSITKVPGSFAKSVDALQRLRLLGIKTTIKAIQMVHTVQGYINIEELARSLGARTTTELNMSAGNDGAQGPLSLAVTDERELVAMSVTPGSPIYVGDESINFSERRRKPGEAFCSAGQSMLSASSDGRIYPCVALPLEVGDARMDSVLDIWRTSSVGQRRKPEDGTPAPHDGRPLSSWQEVRVADYLECGTHERCGWCNKCPGMSLNETGNVLASSSVQCRIANARMSGAKRLRSGQTKDQIFGELGLAPDFGTDYSSRSVPTIPVRFVKQTPSAKGQWHAPILPS